MAVRVVAPAVQVTVGARVYQVDMGGLLPVDTAPGDIERLARKGLVVVEVQPPTIEDGAEFIEGAAGSDPDALTVKAEPVKPLARKPAEK